MTPFTNIYNRAVVEITDYRLSKLYTVDIQKYYDFLRSLLTQGIELFDGCLQSLDYISQVEQDTNNQNVTVWYFTSDLTNKEQSILAKSMVIIWWSQQTQVDILTKGQIPEKDFSKSGQSNMLKEKSAYKDKLFEEFYQMITNYQSYQTNQFNWYGGA